MRRYEDEDENDSFDANGMLKPDRSFRVPLTMMDADAFDPVQRAIARSVKVVDGGTGLGGLNLQKPGFRIVDTRKTTVRDPRGRLEGTWEEEEDDEQERHSERQTSDAAMRARDAAYRNYEDQLVNAWKNPVGFGGDDTITGFSKRGSIVQRESGTGMLDCDENAEDIVRNAATHTESARCRDYCTVEQMMHDHQNRMGDIYDKLDHELSERWRRP
jgi:hypothetical protein